MKSTLQLIPTTGMTRDEWLTYRMTGIGASEVGTILGLDDYTSSLELFYYKIGDVPKFDVEYMAAFMGREQEDLIAKMWQYWDGDERSMIQNYRNGTIIRKCQRVNAYVRNPDYPWLYVSLDRKANKYDERGEGTVEIKTLSGWESQKWEAGLPPKHVTQVNTQMLVCDFSWGEMAVLEDARRFNVLPFEPSPGIQQHIVEKTKEFWEKVEVGKKLVNEKYLAKIQFNHRRLQEINHEIDKIAPEPDASLSYADYLSEKFNKPAYASRQGSLEQLQEAKKHLILQKQEKEIQEMKQLHENRLKSWMGDVEVLDFGTDGKVYWNETKKGRIFKNRVKE